MRVLIVGLGVQGKKRRACAEDDVCATVDPATPAHYHDVRQVPLSDYDAAFVCTPDSLKPDLVTFLLENGKHVLVEKPLLGNPDLFSQLEELARRRRVTCYTAYNHRFEPIILRLKEVLSRGEIGTPYSARLVYGNGTSQDVRRSPWRDQGSGVLGDLGPHLLDLSVFFFGRPSVRGEQVNYTASETSASDTWLFTIRGLPALTFEVSLLSWRNTFSIDVIGSDGSAHLNGLCKWGPSTVTVRQRIMPSGKPVEYVETISRQDPTWGAEYRYFQRLCKTGETNLANDIWINSVLAQLTHSELGEAR